MATIGCRSQPSHDFATTKQPSNPCPGATKIPLFLFIRPRWCVCGRLRYFQYTILDYSYHTHFRNRQARRNGRCNVYSFTFWLYPGFMAVFCEFRILRMASDTWQKVIKTYCMRYGWSSTYVWQSFTQISWEVLVFANIWFRLHHVLMD